MNEASSIAALWLFRVSAGGGLLLLGAWGLMRWTRQPARQQRLGEWGMAAALILAVLSLGPTWLLVPLPAWMEPSPPSATTAPVPGPLPEKEALVENLAPLRGDSAEQQELEVAPFSWSAGPGNEEEADHAGSPGFATPAHDDGEPGAPAPARQPLIQTGQLAAWLAGAWSIGALLVLGHWLLGYLRLWCLLRRSEPVPGWVVQLLADMAAGRRLPRLVISRWVSVPWSSGLFRPTVVLPASLCQTGDASTLRWVFAHELTHLDRRDAWSALLFALGQTVYFFLPWYWWLRRQVRLCQEYIADAAAVAQHRHPEDYAQFLLQLIAAPALPAGTAGVSGHSSDLFRRITMLLQASMCVEKRCPRLCSLAMAGGLLALAVIISGIGLRADAAVPSPSGDQSSGQASTPAPEPPQKNEPKPEEPKPETPRKPSRLLLELDLPDIDELLKWLPAGLDPQQMEQLRKDLEKVREELKRAMEQAREDVRKAVEQARSLPAVPNRFSLLVGRDEERRLGARLERPSEVLAEQLNLPRGQGLVVEQVQPDSAAARAGLKSNDILLELNGKPVSSDPREFSRMLDEIKPNTPVDALVLRKGQKETVKGLALPESRPSRRAVPRLSAPRTSTRVPSGLPGSPNRGPVGASVQITITRTGDDFIARRQEGRLVISVKGTVAGGKVNIAEIRIEADGRVETYTSLDQVPAAYRDRVQSLIEQSTKGSASGRSGKVDGR